MISAIRVKWVPNEKPIITVCTQSFKQSDIRWHRHMDNYTTYVGPLLLSWYRQSEPQLEIHTEKKFELSDDTVEILTNPYVAPPYLDKHPEIIVAIQYTFDMQCMRDSIGNPAYMKVYQINAYLKETQADWRVGLVKDLSSGKEKIEAVKYSPALDGPQTQEYSEPHEVIKVYGEWNDNVKL